MTLEDQLRRDEGVRYSAYLDTLGNLTIGVGHLILPTERWMRWTTLNDAQVTDLLRQDIDIAFHSLKPFDWFENLDPVRQGAVENLCFNIGLPKLLHFASMIHGLATKDWQLAHDECLNSQWAVQLRYDSRTPLESRPGRIAFQFLTGEWQ